MKRAALLLAALLPALGGLPLRAQQSTYVGPETETKAHPGDAIQYVSTSGSDTNDGFSRGTAKATIQAAIDALPTGGGVVSISAGTFDIGKTVTVPAGALKIEGAGRNTTTLRWTGPAGGTVLSLDGFAHSEASGFTVDGNGSAGIGIDFHGVNGQTVNIQDVLENIEIENVTGAPGYGLHVGDAASDETSEDTFREFLIGNTTDAVFQEGSQTVNIVYDGFSENAAGSAHTNFFDLRGGSAAIDAFQGGAYTTDLRAAPGLNWLYVSDMELETSHASPVLLEADSQVGECSRGFRDVRIYWSGAAEGRVFDDEQACALSLVNFRVDSSTSANTGVVYLDPATGTAGGRIELTEVNVQLAQNPGAISRAYTDTVVASAGSTSTINSTGMLPLYALNPDNNSLAEFDRATGADSNVLLFSTGGLPEGAIGNPNSNYGLTLEAENGSNVLETVATLWGGPGGGIKLGSGFSLSSGNTPAASGFLRLGSTDNLTFRNNGNTGDINGLSKDSADVVQVGDAAGIKTAGPEAVAVHLNQTAEGQWAGTVTLASGAGSATFPVAYHTSPICTASDTTATNAVKVSATTTTLHISGTGSDAINFICVGNPN